MINTEFSRIDLKSRITRLENILSVRCPSLTTKEIGIITSRINFTKQYKITVTDEKDKFLNIVCFEFVQKEASYHMSHSTILFGKCRPGSFHKENGFCIDKKGTLDESYSAAAIKYYLAAEGIRSSIKRELILYVAPNLQRN